MMRPMLEKRIRRTIQQRKSCPAAMMEELQDEPKVLPTAHVISMPDEGTIYKNCIHVTEADLKRFGTDVAKLREHQVQPHEHHHRERSLSFGELFEENCRKPIEVSDPWDYVPDPERVHPPHEGDLILNQVPSKAPAKVAEDEAEDPRRLKGSIERMSSNVSAFSNASTAVPRSRASSKESTGKPGFQRAATMPAVARSRSLVLAGAALAM